MKLLCWFAFCMMSVALVAALMGGVAEAAMGKRGLASWYSTKESGEITASGERLNDGAMTCAYWGVPFGTKLLVTHGTRSIIVRVNDRGPSKRLTGRVIDLTRAGFSKLAPISKGLIPVEVEVLR